MVLASLLHAEALLLSLARVQASADFFCGDGAMTLAMMMHGVPAIKPWDTRFVEEFNVLLHGNCLIQLFKAGRLVCIHLALPCQSFSFARLPQLRSWRYKRGLPGLNERQARLIKAGNELLAWTCMIATVAWECQAFFSICQVGLGQAMKC